MTTPRTRHHRGRHIRYCHTCGERIEDGDLIVRIFQMGRMIRTTKYRRAQERPPLEYHDQCYEEGE